MICNKIFLFQCVSFCRLCAAIKGHIDFWEQSTMRPPPTAQQPCKGRIGKGNGMVVQQFWGNGYQLDFDLSNLAAGVYVVQLEDGKNIITKKVVKQ